MPCSSKFCNCNVLIVDEKPLPYFQYIDLICFKCKHRQQISLEYYNLIRNFKVYKVMQIFENAGLTKKFDKRTLMRYVDNVRI